MAFGVSLISIYTIAIAIFCYHVLDLLVSIRTSRKHLALVVGAPSIIASRLISNLLYAGKANSVIQSGYQKFRSRAFQVLRGDGNIILLPQSLLEELSSLPVEIASPNAALEYDLLGPYTGLNLILESRLHYSIVQRKLTPRLSALTPRLEVELRDAISELFPKCDGWTEFRPYQSFAKISARLAGRAMVGPSLCRDPTWMDISINYTESLFKTIVVLRTFPTWMHSALCRLLPSYWAGQSYVLKAKTLLAPHIQKLINMSDKGWTPDTSEEHFNVMAWLADTAKGRDRDANTLAHVEVLLALAAVHTTLLRMTNVLYDLIANPQYITDLEKEILTETLSKERWRSESYSKLQKLDSVMRESQRMSPPTILGMKRLFKRPYTFSDGTRMEKGSYACMPTYAIENDTTHTPKPEIFDGYRSLRLRQQLEALRGGKKAGDAFQFSSMSPTVLSFGYGQSACPGRFFASLVVKMLFVHLLTEYDFQFLPGTDRPKSIIAHEFLFCWPWQKVMIKRKAGSKSPF